MKEIQEFNRRKIICVAHNTDDYKEALRLEARQFGCVVIVKDIHYHYNELRDNHIIMDGSIWDEEKDIGCSIRGKTVKKNEVVWIKGKPLTLSRVLLALEYKQIGFYDGSLIEVVETNGYYKEDYNHPICDWELTKETLEEQSEECQRAVYKLLGGV